MNRTLKIAAFAVVAFATGFAGTAVAQAHVAKKADTCTLPNGDSGYMVSTGDGPICAPQGQS